MDHERLDEIRELFAVNLSGSGMKESRRARAMSLFNRVADDLAGRIPAPQAKPQPAAPAEGEGKLNG